VIGDCSAWCYFVKTTLVHDSAVALDVRTCFAAPVSSRHLVSVVVPVSIFLAPSLGTHSDSFAPSLYFAVSLDRISLRRVLSSDCASVHHFGAHREGFSKEDLEFGSSFLLIYYPFLPRLRPSLVAQLILAEEALLEQPKDANARHKANDSTQE
jgi:hypothetical protein